MKAWKEVRDGSPQRSTGRSQDSRMRAWKEGAAWQPAALEEAKIPECAALEEAKIPEWGLGRRCGMAARSAALEEAKIPE